MRFHTCLRKTVLLALTMVWVSRSAAAQSPDFQWTFDNNGSVDYTLTSVSSTELFAGPLPANDPTIRLTIGKRYQVRVINFALHPLDVIAKGPAASSDVVLLAQGGAVGSFEGDPNVAWSDNGAGTVQFTLTQALADAMSAGSLIPGYRCAVHPSSMRGNFTVGAPSPPPPDFQWTFSDNGIIDYTLTSVSSTELFAGPLPANDPTIHLRIGKRYRVTVVNFAAHPLEVIAKGATDASDVVLLAQGGALGSLEGAAEVAWTDDGAGHVEFTLTQALVDAMNVSGLIPGYRCGVHTSTMRGDFLVLGSGTRIDDPIPQRIAKGTISIELETVIDGLAAPLGLVTPDDGTDRMFVYDQAGQVWLIQSGAPQSPPFLDVSDRLTTLGVAGPGSFDERGFIGFALHPNFATNPRVYTYTSEPPGGVADFTTSPPLPGDPNHHAVIAEWTVDSTNPNMIDKSTRRELLRIEEPQFNHNGGTLRFGPDGFLYIALGDGGAGDDQGDGHGPNGNGQNKNTIYGSLLRIDVDGNNSANGQYGVPGDNPFVGTDGIDEIYAYGLRNPFLFSFDTATGDLYLADVGQNDIEEVNVVTSGGNYGWRLKEGSFFFDPNGDDGGFVTTVPVAPVPPDVIDPIAEYDHDEGSSIIGGFVYRGTALPALQGLYVTGDFGTSFGSPSGRLFYVDGTGTFFEFQIGAADRPLGLWLKGFGRDRSGEIYVCGSEEIGPFGATGKVLKIVPVGTTGVDAWTLYR